MITIESLAFDYLTYYNTVNLYYLMFIIMKKHYAIGVVIWAILLSLLLNSKWSEAYGISFSITSGLMLWFWIVLAYNTYYHKWKWRAYIVAWFLILTWLINILWLS